jgi:pectate lyase-like protein
LSYTLLTGDPRAFGTGNPPQDVNNLNDVLNGNQFYYNVLNTVWNGTGADPTGATDSTAAIQACLNAAPQGSIITIPVGTYVISNPLVMNTPNVTIQGFGLGTTARTGSSAIVMSPSFAIGSAPQLAAIVISAAGCQVQNLCVFGNSSTTTSNPYGNGIEVYGASFVCLTNLFMQYINGWCIEALATASQFNNGLSVTNITGYNSAGGFHGQGVTGTSFQGQHSLIDLQFSQIGVSTGTYANLDALKFEDISDILTLNTNCAVSSASTGSTLHIKGLCTSHLHVNVDVGVYPTAAYTGSVLLIEDSGNGSAKDVKIFSGVLQAGNIGGTISGGASQITLAGVNFKNNQTTNLILSGTGSAIDIADCSFQLGGQGATGSTNYDLSITGTLTGDNKVHHCKFLSPIVSSGTAGVQSSVNVTTTGVPVMFTDDDFGGTSITVSSCFTALPFLVRNCRNFNPHGSISGPPAMPATTVASTAYHYDTMAYITAGTANVTVVRNTNGQGGGASPTITIPASTCVGIFVPAQTTWTPTYASGSPTLVIDGL